MRQVFAVCERELRALVRQPVAWVISGIYLLLHAVSFAQLMEGYSRNSLRLLSTATEAPDFTLVDRVLRPLLVADSFVLMILLPALTMRLLADEWRQGTSDLLLTYPLRERHIVVGKFLAAFAIAATMVLLGSVSMAATSLFGNLEWPVFLLGTFGLLLFVAMVVALGIAASATTENQVLAFASTLMVLLLMLAGSYWGLRAEAPWDAVFRHLSFTGHVGHFAFGEWRVSSTFFFLGLIAIYLYAATGLLGRRRWSGGGG